jgi:hypothetical protein
VTIRVCDACLRRTWLVARLAGWIELARHEGRRLPEVLALADELPPWRRRRSRARWRRARAWT